MSSNPVTQTIPEWEWTKVSDKIVTKRYSLVDSIAARRLRYFLTYRLPGEVPTAITPGTVPEEAVEIFRGDNFYVFKAPTPVDVYIFCMNEDDDEEEVGRVRVDEAAFGANDFGSVVTLDTFNSRVFNHEVFSLHNRIIIPAGETYNYVLNPTEKGVYPKGTLALLPFRIVGYGAGPLFIDVYINPTTSNDGTLVDIFDRNYNSPVTPHSTVRLNPTITDDGTKSPYESAIFSAAAPGASKPSTEADSAVELVSNLDPSVPYMLRIKNTDASNAASCVVAVDLFEV